MQPCASLNVCCLWCCAAQGSKQPAAAPVVPKEPVKPVVYPNKEAAKEAFKQLLQVKIHMDTFVAKPC